MSAESPSTLDKLAALTGQAAIYIPVAGQFVQIASVGLHALAEFLDTSGADLAELDKTHAEYQRRIAVAKDPLT
jgi:hypothetical protein